TASRPRWARPSSPRPRCHWSAGSRSTPTWPPSAESAGNSWPHATGCSARRGTASHRSTVRSSAPSTRTGPATGPGRRPWNDARTTSWSSPGRSIRSTSPGPSHCRCGSWPTCSPRTGGAACSKSTTPPPWSSRTRWPALPCITCTCAGPTSTTRTRRTSQAQNSTNRSARCPCSWASTIRPPRRHPRRPQGEGGSWFALRCLDFLLWGIAPSGPGGQHAAGGGPGAPPTPAGGGVDTQPYPPGYRPDGPGEAGAPPPGLAGPAAGLPGPPGTPGTPPRRRRRVPRWVKWSAVLVVIGLIFRRAIAAVVLMALSAAFHLVGINVHLPHIKFAWPWQAISAGTTTNTELGPWVLQKIEGISKPALGRVTFNFYFTHKVSKDIGPWPCWYASTFYAVGHAAATVNLNPGPAWWAPSAGHYQLRMISHPPHGKPGHVAGTMGRPRPPPPHPAPPGTIHKP